jgi:hypothetical protein
MSIKKNRELMFEQIKRLKGELKESVNEARAKSSMLLQAKGTNIEGVKLTDKQKKRLLGIYKMLNHGGQRNFDKTPISKLKSAYSEFLGESVNEAETDGMSQDLIKKIEVVIKKGLGINKLAGVSGPHRSRYVGKREYFFRIGKPSVSLHYGPTQIIVTKQISNFEGYDDYYTAAIDLGGMMGDDWKGYGRKQYTTEAELLKAIYNMAKKHKDKLTFVMDGKSYLKQ